MRPLEPRVLFCAVCKSPIAADSLNSPNPEAPEMMRLPDGGWFGFTRTDEETTDIVVCCGQDCAQKLLAEG